jgi:hypothetical protein
VINTILDSRSEVNLLSERLYEEFTQSGVDIPVLPVEHVIVTAFGKRLNKIKQQALIEFTVGNDLFESVFMVSSQHTNEAIIGCQFLKEYGVGINVDRETFSYIRGAELREHSFVTKVGLKKVMSDD